MQDCRTHLTPAIEPISFPKDHPNNAFWSQLILLTVYDVKRTEQEAAYILFEDGVKCNSQNLKNFTSNSFISLEYIMTLRLKNLMVK